MGKKMQLICNNCGNKMNRGVVWNAAIEYLGKKAIPAIYEMIKPYLGDAAKAIWLKLTTKSLIDDSALRIANSIKIECSKCGKKGKWNTSVEEELSQKKPKKQKVNSVT